MTLAFEAIYLIIKFLYKTYREIVRFNINRYRNAKKKNLGT